VKLTIVTVTKNSIDLLAKTYQTIISQECQSFEWIIVDALSGDGTRELLEEIKTKSNFRVTSRAPFGIYDAMNVGASDVKNGWILFLNAGDIFMSTKSISRILETLDGSQNMDCVALPVLHLTPNGYIYDLTSPEISANHFRIHHQGAFMSAKAFHREGGYDSSLKWAADGKLLDSICRQGLVEISHHIEIGFEIGGASALNYREVLLETSTYRNSQTSVFDLCLLRVKNRIKLGFVKLSKSRISPVTYRYFQLRQNRVIQNRLKFNSEIFNEEDHTFREILNLKF
jgi:glycosyltransferase involved in cell wall biosynthesis